MVKEDGACCKCNECDELFPGIHKSEILLLLVGSGPPLWIEMKIRRLQFAALRTCENPGSTNHHFIRRHIDDDIGGRWAFGAWNVFRNAKRQLMNFASKVTASLLR